MLAWVWGPIVLINVLHYSTESSDVWVHNVLRRLFYLPLVVSAVRLGTRGGLWAAFIVSLTYVPHAFLELGPHVHGDPAGNVDKALEIVLYNAVGLLTGILTDLELRRRQQLNLALREQQLLQQQLVRADRLAALGEVVAGIAHEIKNPLHALKGTAEVIAPLIPATAKEHRMWELHVSELDRLERVATRFLSFAHPKPLVAEAVDLREVARRLVDLAGAEARKRDIAIQAHLPDHPVIVEGDRDQLAQVGLNIVLNALQAIGSQGGHVVVSVTSAASAHAPLHRLSIENDGPAIPEDELERLFDPFHGSGASTGLGLSISARIVEQHGGYLDVDHGGLGVKFTISLPASADEAGPAP
jgi:signal transduction histidine kinase